MTDHNDPSLRSSLPSAAGAPRGSIENVAAEDLVSLQSALEGWQRERERLLARSHAVENDAQAKLQHLELRLHQAVSQLEATKRSAHAVRVRLEADVQAARARTEQTQQALTASQAVTEQLHMTNAELSTALDAVQWRLGELEAENTTHREALRDSELQRQAEHQGLGELELAIALQRQAASAATTQHAAVAAALAALQRRAAELEERIDRLNAERAGLLAAAEDAQQQRANESHEREALRQRVNDLDAERAVRCAREAALQRELDDLRETHERLRTASAEELAALRAELAARERTQAEAVAVAANAHAAYTIALHTWEDAASQHQAHLAAARDEVAAFAARAQGLEEELLATLQQRQELDEQLAAARAERLQSAAQHQSERDTLGGRLLSLEDALQQRDVIIDRLRGVEDELQRLRVAHADELSARRETATQREAALVAARDALANQLADEQARSSDMRDQATARAARILGFEADLRVAHEQRQQLEDHLAAAHADRAQIEARWQTEREVFEQDLQRLRTTHTDTLTLLQEQAAQHASEQEALASRIGSLEDALRQRDACIQQLHTERAQSEERLTHAQQAAEEAARRRKDEWRATHKALQDELDTTRRNLTDADAARIAAQQCSNAVEEQQARQTRELKEARAHAEATAALAQQSAAACVAAEQRAAESDLRCNALAEQLDGMQKQATQAQHQREAMAAQIAELENERSTLNLRVDELTALTGELERECERLRRDRGSSEDTRRLKAENARLEAKIVELDRQRSEAVQRHSAAVAGYMVELNQRSEALHTRELELQKTMEELALVKQSCEDAMGELEAQRRAQGALERQLAELRTAPAVSIKPPAVEPNGAAAPARPSAAPPAAARPPIIKPAKRPAQGESVAGPVTVIHVEENKALCDAARAVVSRVPDSQYTNALDPAGPSVSGSRLLAINLVSRTHDPVEAVMSFIAADTYHRSVLAYCADGTSGFSFGMADFFSPPIDPDACVARLMESLGAIQRLLAVTENFSVVGALRGVLSRMRSSVSAALDLRQVIDLLPMVEPDVILIDLALPRGEGLRLVSRLRSDPKTRELPLGVLLTAPGNAAEFRQHALRAARDIPMAAADLAATIGHRLGMQPAPITATRLQPTANARA